MTAIVKAIQSDLLSFQVQLPNCWTLLPVRLTFLDGLRSIAILLVVSGHLSHQFAETYEQTLYSKLPFSFHQTNVDREAKSNR